MTTNTPRAHGNNPYGLLAFTIVIVEIVIIGGGCGIIYATGRWGNAPLWLESVFKIIYLLGFVSLIFSGIGLSRDENKAFAGTALFLEIICLGIFGLMFAV